VLLAYVKISLERAVLADVVVDEAWTTDVLVGISHAVAGALRHPDARSPAAPRDHRDIPGQRGGHRGGTSFVFRAMEESGASAADVIRHTS